ncbi:MAG TPA: hypothetical protein VM328_04395, partial [Fimbriimonadaceae bacterium]|nr:hypothetical protein [Fimbriimonadaceae bacterium]
AGGSSCRPPQPQASRIKRASASQRTVEDYLCSLEFLNLESWSLELGVWSWGWEFGVLESSRHLR